jgi:hypothetical protein
MMPAATAASMSSLRSIGPLRCRFVLPWRKPAQLASRTATIYPMRVVRKTRRNVVSGSV